MCLKILRIFFNLMLDWDDFLDRVPKEIWVGSLRSFVDLDLAQIVENRNKVGPWKEMEARWFKLGANFEKLAC